MTNLNLSLPEGFLEEEVRCGYTVPEKMKEVWAVELDLLNEFMKVCHKYHLKFFAAGGTLLGAIRHKGFVPWDDDVDVMMFREDYDKLNAVAKDEFAAPYFWQTEETDRGSMRGHAQLRNSLTTGILKGELPYKRSFNQGIFIDIFPLEGIPDDEAQKRRFFEQYNRLKSKIYRYRRLQQPLVFHLRKNLVRLAFDTVKDVAEKYFTNIRKKETEAYYEWIHAAGEYQHRETERVVMMPFFEERWVMNRSDLRDTIDVPFEMLQLPVPIGYEPILNHTYGSWKQFVKGGSVHGGVLFDTNRPYTDYL